MKSLPPLRKRFADGSLYERRPEIKAHIDKCLDLPVEKLCEYSTISSRTHADYIPSEVLVFFLRQTKTDNSDARFNALYTVLTDRIKNACPRPEVSMGDEAQLLNMQDFVLDYFSECAVIDRTNYNEKLDTFEHSFDQAIVRRKYDAMRKMYRKEKPTTQLEYDGSDVSVDVERTLALLHPDASSIEDNFTYLFQRQQAIDTLPDDEKRVINMIFAGYSQEEIAKSVKCGVKTVRNRRDRAVKKLLAILGTEAGHVE